MHLQPPPPLPPPHCSLCQTFIHLFLPSPHPPPPSFIQFLSSSHPFTTSINPICIHHYSGPRVTYRGRALFLFSFLFVAAACPASRIDMHAYVNESMHECTLSSRYIHQVNTFALRRANCYHHHPCGSLTSRHGYIWTPWFICLLSDT